MFRNCSVNFIIVFIVLFASTSFKPVNIGNYSIIENNHSHDNLNECDTPLIPVNSEPIKVLIIGNSYVIQSDLLTLVPLLAEDLGVEITVELSATGGATLEDHWKGNRGLNTKERIASGFDIVVLQDQSLRPILTPEKTKADIKKFSKFIRKYAASPYLFLTWARESRPQTQSTLNETYSVSAKSNAAVLVPVGLAWQAVRARWPNISLYVADGSHPSKSGGYLSALVLLETIIKESGLSSKETLSYKRDNLKITKENKKRLADVAKRTLMQ